MSDAEKKTVLLVEDQKFIRNIVALNLKKLGYEVYEAEDGAQGYKLANEKRPDIILSDLMMPVMNGFEMLKQLKSNDDLRKIPVIILSAMQQKEQILEAINLGAMDYITKPFKIEIAKMKISQTFKKAAEVSKQVQLDTFPVFFKSHVLIVKCDDDFISMDYFKKIYNTIIKYKQDIAEIILDLKENTKIDSLNVVFFDKFFVKLASMNVTIKLVVINEDVKIYFNTPDIKTTIRVFVELKDALPVDIDINDVKDLRKLGAEDLKYSLPIIFDKGIPVINMYLEPTIEQIDNLDKDFAKLIDYNKNRVIVDFHNIHSVPARFAGTLIKYQSILVLKHDGKIELVIKSQALITQLKEGGFLSKFEVYNELEKAMEHINF